MEKVLLDLSGISWQIATQLYLYRYQRRLKKQPRKKKPLETDKNVLRWAVAINGYEFGRGVQMPETNFARHSYQNSFLIHLN